MEDLNLSDNGPPTPRPAPVQLPPQLFTTAASLLDLTDKKLLTTLRDGRKLIGVLRSWDQYGNLVLTDTVERRFYTLPPQGASDEGVETEELEGPRHLYSDEERGIYIVRGENIVLMGELDLDRDDNPPPNSTLISASEMHKLTHQPPPKQNPNPSLATISPLTKQQRQKVEIKQRRLRMLGFEGEGMVGGGDVVL